MEQIYKQYYSRLLSFINSKVHDTEDAKDILSEVFIKIYKNIDKLDSDEKLTSWIFTITRNSIIDFYRKNAKNRDNIEFNEEYIFKNKEQADAISELSECIKPIINSLAPKYAQALYLSEIKELKQKEIADKLDISSSSIKSIIFRGKKQIKEKLHQCCSYKYDNFGNIVEFDIRDKNCNFC
ncbi:sigma-70 family RNA polymerase sigma factor [Sulfurimonas sp.]|uniref:sigma-70 family RNA polymerase sigma factor n=1 Tax=Sulfurimonas sp. TaxID=2022749 RepID=UPI001A007CA9|nr:sigma-70 family RNA polymerase sigma factor [Sulfurimonas sp.]MBE0514404.1 sigma-70 family RNA polymerase sigma factor [Sulfurimonas sp.]